MAPKVTSSRNRSTRKASKRPTSSKNRPQRSRASTNSSRTTTGGQGVGSGKGRVTTGQGTSNPINRVINRFMNWYNQGRRPGEAKMGVRELIKDDWAQRQRTQGPGKGRWNPVRGMPGYGSITGQGQIPGGSQTGPTPAIRQAVERGIPFLLKATTPIGLLTMAGGGPRKTERAPAGTYKKMLEAQAGKYNTMDPDGTIRSRLIVGPKIVGDKTEGAKSFDSAFAAARSAGLGEFTWRGKRYNTKLKGE